jgi:alkanesulfonate monooxygenase SsuD/methylene tetrahydromethanopterin reductase-like flavin-dependent oxidoreductase (luciferase family)
MDIAIGLPATIPGTKGSLVLEWAKRADSGPFSSLGILDRLVYPNHEPLITLAAAAAVTERVRLMTTVLLAPLRRAGVLAKQAATIDALSGGRLTLGLGVGAREDDFQFAPASFHDRGRRFEEQLELMKRVWSGQPVSDEIGPVGPPPVQAGGPELLIGGYTPVSVRRVGRWGDGFISGACVTPSRCANCSASQRTLGGPKVGKAGRGSSPLSTTLSVRTRIGVVTTYATTTATLGRVPTTWRDPSPPRRRPSSTLSEA